LDVYVVSAHLRKPSLEQGKTPLPSETLQADFVIDFKVHEPNKGFGAIVYDSLKLGIRIIKITTTYCFIKVLG